MSHLLFLLLSLFKTKRRSIHVKNKLISVIVPDGEKPAIINGAFEDYMVDEGTMIRYARRKGADQKMVRVLQEYGKAGEP